MPKMDQPDLDPATYAADPADPPIEPAQLEPVPVVGSTAPSELPDDTMVYQAAALHTGALLHEGSAAFGSIPGLNGKDEMNLAEFPIARLGRSDTRLTIEYKGQITDKLGNVIEQRWLVSGNATFGLPTEFADRVLVALMFITNKENLREKYPDRRVPFTTYRILKLLGLSLNQRNYAAVEKALQQLVGVTIYSEGAFWDHQQQKRITTKKGFHILEEFWLKSFDDEGTTASALGEDATSEMASKTEADVTDEDGPSPSRAHHPAVRPEDDSDNGNSAGAASITGYIVWGERIWDSFQAGYIKNLDVEFYYTLENTLARRLYRFLDKRMHYQNSYQIDIFDLAARMGMKPYPYASHLARKLKPAFDELQNRGFLASAEIVKVGDFTRVRFVRVQELLGTDANDGGNVGINATDEIGGSRYPSTSSQGFIEGRSDTETHIQVQTHTRHSQNASEADFLPSAQCRTLWAALLAEYQRTLPPATYAMLASSQLVQLDDHVATIVVEPRYQEWIARQMVRQIKSLLNQSLTDDQRVAEVSIVTR